ncbi:response regulator transcription factor [Cohnella zeiphila]|uniref:Response regulator n=1 Tax=Cohnella zeiphila TaxID=2761120 RepID=A0A7X0VVH5_9BACL|nr:response regulator [Cohnella zeiphila]MBB6732159.1 response regulator [Cohnella zeiphila]
MRILVVDDESEIRDYLAGLPQWEQARCTIVGTAANGEEALGLVERTSPDVLLTDIRMPVMDGIALAEAVRTTRPDLPIIFLTAHHEFEYARQAVRLGAADFITKPFRPEDLVNAVEQLRARERDDWLEQDSFFMAIGGETLAAEQKREWLLGRGIEDGNFVLLYAELDHAQGSPYSRNPFALKQVRKALETVSKREGTTVWMSETASGVYALLPCRSDSETDASRSIGFAKRMIEACESQEELSVSVGISRTMASFLDLPEAIGQTGVCMDYRMLLGKKTVLAFDAIETIVSEKEKESLSSVNRVAELLRTGETDGIRASISAAYRRMLSVGASRKDIQHFCIGMIERSEDVLLEFGIEPDARTAVEIRETMLSSLILTDMMRSLERYLLDNAEEIRRLLSQSPKRLVAETKMIIDREYASELTLQAVAKRLNVNYSYLSRLIKKETGVNFTDMLWDCRIEAAKVKLLSDDLKAYEIAYAVGFKDSAHFSLLFKKMAGFTPSEYKRQAGGKLQ